MSEETIQKQEETKTYPYTVAIRFHNNSKSYTFGTELDDLQIGDMVVVETSQGIELGKCHTPSMSSVDYPVDMSLKPVLRRALDSDINQYEENIQLAKEALKICEEEVEKLGLGMHLLNSEYMLDRSKILFIYQAESRVDFRELLKHLGARLHCRIELRQIGERDKAKMVGGIGMCGMECCCSRFKTNLEVVSINMAKTQLLALNTEKLSGMCGKLMCCLRYENENYKEMTKDLPKMGAHVEYNDEIFKVTSMNVLTNEARIENHEHVETITIDELKEDAIVRKGVPITKNQNGAKGKNMKPLNERVKENVIANRAIDEQLKKEKAPMLKQVAKKIDATENNVSDTSADNQTKRKNNKPKNKNKRNNNNPKQNNNQKRNKPNNQQPRNNKPNQNKNRKNNANKNQKSKSSSNMVVRSFKAKNTKDAGGKK